MRSGIWRGVAIAIVAGMAIGFGSALEARADGLFHHTIPRETLAMDYRTGDVMMAPPIPYGEYAKDYVGSIHGAAGTALGAVHGLGGKLHGLCDKCGGGLCGQCGGKGLFHGKGCGGCGGDGCGSCDGGSAGGCRLFHGGVGGLFGHKGGGTGCGDSLCGNSHGLHGGNGLASHGGSGVSCVGPGCEFASAQAAPATIVMASSQTSGACGSCLGMGKLGNGGGCGLCGGTGRIKSLFGKFCGNCMGKGCGGCGGSGLLGHGNGSGCGACGGKGCGLCGGLLGRGNGSGCGACGGKGCGLCAGLKAKAHHILGAPAGLAAKLLHKGDIKYFVGPGGPVPLTPGYVPYINPVRSPRDFFAFPPFSEQVP